MNARIRTARSCPSRPRLETARAPIAHLDRRSKPPRDAAVIRRLHVEGYRSIRGLKLALGPVNVITGANGAGKSNLYNSVMLVHHAANGDFAQAMAREGGMPSALWAGPLKRKKDRKRIVVAVELEDFSYSLAVGLPPPSGSPFDTIDPDFKEEYVWMGAKRTPASTLLERGAQSANVRDKDGQRVTYPFQLMGHESIMAQLEDPHLYPVLSAVREEIRQWRFYHHFRTDAEAPLRHPQIGFRTPVLSHDGADLAAALQTILEIGDADLLRTVIRRTFGGAELQVDVTEDGRFTVGLAAPNLMRPLTARELSDGTLRFMCLVAAVLTPRPPPLLAFNEPETSLHPDLIEPLAELLAEAGTRSQVWITTHSRALAEAVADSTDGPVVELALRDSETVLD